VRRAGLDVQVVHPITLLDRAYSPSPSALPLRGRGLVPHSLREWAGKRGEKKEK
jgi:hypothetical protein